MAKAFKKWAYGPGRCQKKQADAVHDHEADEYRHGLQADAEKYQDKCTSP